MTPPGGPFDAVALPERWGIGGRLLSMGEVELEGFVWRPFGGVEITFEPAVLAQALNGVCLDEATREVAHTILSTVGWYGTLAELVETAVAATSPGGAECDVLHT